MNLLHAVLSRVSRTLAAYAGDGDLMQAAVSAAANVIVADGEMSGEEFETAVAGMKAHPILDKGYDVLMLEAELYDGVARARTRAGRVENLRRIGAIAKRAVNERQDVFLIAADVADHEGISGIEDRTLAEIADALSLDKAALLARAKARPTPSPSDEIPGPPDR